MEDDEPLVFVAQINRSELHELPGTEVLPPSGLLSFFAEYDGVMACRFEARTIAIHYWPDVDALVPAAPATPPVPVPPAAPVVVRPGNRPAASIQPGDNETQAQRRSAISLRRSLE